MEITITIPDDGKEVLESWLGIGGIQSWIQHASENKLRQRVDASILEETDKNPKKMDQVAKLEILKNIKLPTREERDKKNH